MTEWVVLDLGSGKYSREPGHFTVDYNKDYTPQLVADVFQDGFWDLLPKKKWKKIVCKNVVNYAPSYGAVKEFLLKVKDHLEPDGVFELDFMNVSNFFTERGVLLFSPYIMKPLLLSVGFKSTFLTKRHWVVPTGNVRVVCST